QHALLISAVFDAAAEDRGFADPTAAVAALEWQGDTGTQPGFEQRLVAPRADGTVARMQGDAQTSGCDAPGRQPREQHEERGCRTEQQPGAARRPRVHQREDAEIE